MRGEIKYNFADDTFTDTKQDKHLKLEKLKSFHTLELLVVLAVLGVFSVIAYPNISSWITDVR